MASLFQTLIMGDVQDILGLERPPTPELTKEAILGSSDKLKKKQLQMSTPKVSKRPEGMPREVFALLYNDNKGVPPVFPTDTGEWDCCFHPLKEAMIPLYLHLCNYLM